ncbi:MAG: ABC transporter permease [Actinomycetota bacterium]|nr:ABC transporter permease [Actinomycetota bacterium]
MGGLAEARAVAPPGAARRNRPIARFLVRRVAAALGTLLVVSMLVFAGTEVLPGDAAGAVLGKTATPAQVAQLRKAMGLDRPIAVQYGDWLSGFARGDLGDSAAGYAAGSRLPIWEQVRPRLVASLWLSGITALLMIPLSLLLGVIAARHAGRPIDVVISVTSLAIISLPEFVIGSLLILVLFSWLDALPPVALLEPGQSPLAHPRLLVLPVLTLLGATLAASVRMTRAGMIQALRADFAEMARLNGFPERRVVWRHALRNALAPAVQVFAQNLQYLIGGVIVVEYLFGYPGLGKELVDSVAIRDVSAVQSIALLIAIAVVCLNLIADLLVVLLVPRLRTAAR